MWMGNSAHTGLAGESTTSKVSSQAFVLPMEKVQLKLSLLVMAASSGSSLGSLGMASGKLPSGEAFALAKMGI
jgi:hypothetical protein